MMDPSDTRTFEVARPRLLGLAYRILGTRADAEDAVQDCFLKWVRTDRAVLDNPASWLTTACTRRCLDMLRSAQRSRTDYVGAWLPEPIHVSVDNDADARLDLASSLTMAFLLMLERLTPKERAAFLLHDVFDNSYSEIATALDMQESACRKLVSRAKANIGQAKLRHSTPRGKQEDLLSAFQSAIRTGTTGNLAKLLAEDVRLSADGGGKVTAIRKILHGKETVMSFLSEGLSVFWASHVWVPSDINGVRGYLLKNGETIEAVVSFGFDQAGLATDIYIVRNPDKLANLDPVTIQ